MRSRSGGGHDHVVLARYRQSPTLLAVEILQQTEERAAQLPVILLLTPLLGHGGEPIGHVITRARIPVTCDRNGAFQGAFWRILTLDTLGILGI